MTFLLNLTASLLRGNNRDLEVKIIAARRVDSPRVVCENNTYPQLQLVFLQRLRDVIGDNPTFCRAQDFTAQKSENEI